MSKNLRLLFLFSALFVIVFTQTAIVSAQNAPPPPPPKATPPARGVPANTMAPAEDEPPANSTVRGRVFYENTGRPVRRSSIMLISLKEGPGEMASGITGGDGSFEIKNVSAGTYYAVVNAPGVVTPLAYADFTKARQDEGMKKAFEKFEPIEVNGINDVQVQVLARQGGAISGRITYSNGDPAIGVRVEILRKADEQFIPVISNFTMIFSMFSGGGSETDDRGMYRYAGLPEGEYIVKVTEKASHGDNDSPDSMFNPFSDIFGTSSLLTVYFPDVFETSEAQIVRVILGQENYETNLTIPDRDLFKVGGKIVSKKDGKPIPGASFSLKRVGNNTFSLMGQARQISQQNKSNEQGHWNFKELPPGTYKLTVVPPDPGTNYFDEEGFPANSANVAIATNRTGGPKPEPKFAGKTQEFIIIDQDLAGLTIELGYGAVISGTVVTENSTEMPEDVTVSTTDESGESVVATSIYNFSGEYFGDKKDGDKSDDYGANISAPGPATPTLVNHDFTLEAVPPGKVRFQVSVDDEEFYVKSATLRGVNLLAEPLELKEGDQLKDVKVVLSKDVGTIEGKLLDGDRQPVKNLDFALVPTDTARRRATSFYKYVSTDSDGGFSVKAAPGEYAIVIFDQTAMARDMPGFFNWLDGVIGDAPKVKFTAGETESVTLTLP